LKALLGGAVLSIILLDQDGFHDCSCIPNVSTALLRSIIIYPISGIFACLRDMGRYLGVKVKRVMLCGCGDRRCGVATVRKLLRRVIERRGR
jgi:hypothetical protein